ncbi:MAG TPA: hypothetical protein PLJ42_07820 [Chitinophagales bacterium]|nr:hypothetical protein [Chitinophagales bacterium]HQV78130.1 hypothetical protein [Chitinophagales bacterium]HQW79327.1 hypothetical protein [Chitinophagales bacterium]HRB67235.1 hypothetical protein [Chitinophagales bacterium]
MKFLGKNPPQRQAAKTLGASVKNDRAKINGTAKMTEQQECFLFFVKAHF